MVYNYYNTVYGLKGPPFNGFSGWPLPPNYGEGWASIAQSDFNEWMVVWTDGCTNAGGCAVEWAWTNNDGGTWFRGGLVDAHTYSRPTVDYAPGLAHDRFVLAYIDSADSRVTTRSMFAGSTAAGWSAPVGTVAAPYRYLGGIAFDSAGRGLLVAASGVAGSKGRIAQFEVSLSGTGNYTLLSNATWAAPVATVTRRPFGIAYDESTNTSVIAYRDTGSPRPMAILKKTGISVGTSYAGPTFAHSNILSGIDVAFDPTNHQFIATYEAN